MCQPTHCSLLKERMMKYGFTFSLTLLTFNFLYELFLCLFTHNIILKYAQCCYNQLKSRHFPQATLFFFNHRKVFGCFYRLKTKTDYKFFTLASLQWLPTQAAFKPLSNQRLHIFQIFSALSVKLPHTSFETCSTDTVKD